MVDFLLGKACNIYYYQYVVGFTVLKSVQHIKCEKNLDRGDIDEEGWQEGIVKRLHRIFCISKTRERFMQGENWR